MRRPIGFAGSGQDAAEGVVEVALRVDEAVRGPVAGSTYTLREWSGLWAGQFERYRVGQRLLLFLYAPDVRGLSAPVHGAEGLVPLRGGGVAPGPDDSSAAAAEWLVDLRWVQAQVRRRRTLKSFPVDIAVGPGPVRGIVSESMGQRSQVNSDPLLVHAIFTTGAGSTLAPVEAEPLSRVLALCNEAVVLDVMRRRDGTH